MQPSLGWASLISKAPLKKGVWKDHLWLYPLWSQHLQPWGGSAGPSSTDLIAVATLGLLRSHCSSQIPIGNLKPKRRLTHSNLSKDNTLLRRLIKLQKPKANKTSGRARKPSLSSYSLSIITVILEWDPEEMGAPEGAVRRKTNWLRRIVVNRLLSISSVPNTAPYALNLSTSFSPYVPLLPPFYTRKLRFKEIKYLAQGHAATHWQSQDLTQRVWP